MIETVSPRFVRVGHMNAEIIFVFPFFRTRSSSKLKEKEGDLRADSIHMFEKRHGRTLKRTSVLMSFFHIYWVFKFRVKTVLTAPIECRELSLWVRQASTVEVSQAYRLPNKIMKRNWTFRRGGVVCLLFFRIFGFRNMKRSRVDVDMLLFSLFFFWQLASNFLFGFFFFFMGFDRLWFRYGSCNAIIRITLYSVISSSGSVGWIYFYWFKRQRNLA